jgi:hypothetical protein
MHTNDDDLRAPLSRLRQRFEAIAHEAAPDAAPEKRAAAVDLACKWRLEALLRQPEPPAKLSIHATAGGRELYTMLSEAVQAIDRELVGNGFDLNRLKKGES